MYDGRGGCGLGSGQAPLRVALGKSLENSMQNPAQGLCTPGAVASESGICGCPKCEVWLTLGVWADIFGPSYSCAGMAFWKSS